MNTQQRIEDEVSAALSVFYSLPLPALVGSEKQVKWAESIRKTQFVFAHGLALKLERFTNGGMDDFELKAARRLYDDSEIAEAARLISPAINGMIAETKARVWIDLGQSSSVIKMLNEYGYNDVRI